MAARKQWTKEEDNKFEQSLAIYPELSPNRFQNEALSRDLSIIESGLDVDKPVNIALFSSNPISLGSKHEDKKVKRWTEDEHRQFLIGLKRYGKGDWRGISRNSVVTKTPSQVASHAQKYFERLNLDENKKKRPSINDITIEDSTSLPAPVSNMDLTTQDETLIPLQLKPWQEP